MRTLIKKPFLPSAVLIVADILVLLGAIVINILRESIGYDYILEDKAVVLQDPLGWYAAVAAVLLGVAAALTAAQIVVNVILARKKTASDEEFRGDVLFLNLGSLGLLVISVVVALFAMWFSVPQRPVSEEFYCYDNGRYAITIAEQRWSDGTLSGRVYDTTHADDVKLVHNYELGELSDSAERYELSGLSQDVVRILYTDGDIVRTLHIDLSIFHQGHEHSEASAITEQNENEVHEHSHTHLIE